jgi:phage pi2 protein 07
MDNNNGLVPMGSEFSSKKSPWEKPGGKLGMVVAGLGIAGAGYLLYLLLPIMISLASNVLYLILMLFGIGILGYILTSKKFWNTFKVAYFIIMRRITGFFIKIDPVAILEDYIRDLQKRIREVSDNINQVRGLIKKNERKLNEVTDKRNNTILEIKHYRQSGQNAFAQQKEGLLVLYEKSVKDRTARLETSKKWLEALTKLQQYATFSVTINEEKVKLFKDEYEELKAQGKAFRSIKSALNGDPDMMENFETAVEIMENEISMNLGEIEDMIDETNGLLGQADMENAVISDKATAILQKYDNQEGIFNENRWKGLPEPEAQPIQRLSNEELSKRDAKGRKSYFD